MDLPALPPEVLEQIFLESTLHARDLANLCQTCSTFRNVIDSNSIWRAKFRDRWPHLYRYLFDKNLVSQTETQWKSVYHQRVQVKQTVVEELSELFNNSSRRSFSKYQRADNEAQLYNFCQLLPENVSSDFKLLFVTEEMRRILLRGHSWENLTLKYYAKKALWYFHHQCVLPAVQKFMAAAPDEQDIEEGATLIAQWFQPQEDFTVADIQVQFDVLAASVKEVLKTVNPDHPLFSKEASLPENLQESLWKTTQCRQILDAMETVLKPIFNKEFGTYFTPCNSYINLVLKNKQGIPITLCLTVMCVAKRLGFVLEPVSFPQHFILKWMEFPAKSGIHRYTFVDVFNGAYSVKFEELGDRLLLQHTPTILESHCNRCSNQEVLLRMLRNLLNVGRQQRSDSGLELLGHAIDLTLLFMPGDMELVILSAQVALLLRLNLSRACERIESIREGGSRAENAVLSDLQAQCREMLHAIRMQHLHREEIRSQGIKGRTHLPEIQFAVGMVMRHKKYNYLCVIRGWDSRCMASEQWISQMGVDRCQRGRHQPFYNVWVWDGSDRYAAEENLAFTKDAQLISHPEVGRLFDSFTGRYYIPGTQLREEYPDDLQITHTKVTEFFETD